MIENWNDVHIVPEFSDQGVDCYRLAGGSFVNEKITSANILSILRGALNYPLEESCYKEHIRVHDISFMSSERVFGENDEMSLDIKYCKLTMVPNSTLMIGDIIASGETLVQCLRYVTDYYRRQGAQLRNIVESAGLLEHVDFDTQVVVTDADGHTQRPDMIIHMPGGKTIPIDAKAPYADYQRACEIPDTASPEELARKNELLHSHAKAVRDHVKTLGDKAYWNAFSDAPDFVIAFIPNESLLQAALETDPTLMDDAFAQKVALTSPITLWAVLKSVAYAWQQQSLTDDAKMLFDLSRELYERFAVLGERATKLGSAITKTVGAYNSFAASLESRVLVTARKLQRVDQSKVIGTVDMIAPEKGDIRELSAPETNAE